MPVSVNNIDPNAFQNENPDLMLYVECNSYAQSWARQQSHAYEGLHHTLQTIPEVAATCETDGLSEGEVCIVCTDVVTPQVVVPALGHDWDAVAYTWDTEKTHVTATRICKNDASHVDTETVAATSKITVEADCERDGELTYTSDAFENPAFSAQVLIEVIPAIGHDWEKIEFAWSEDRSEVTVTAVCTHDASHKLNETVKATGKETKAPTCETPGEMTYTSDPFMTSGIPVQVKTESIPATDHQWGAVTYTWSDDHLQVEASRTCVNDPSHIEKETVTTSSIVTKQASCEEEGEITYTTLGFTNPDFDIQTKAVVVPATGHAWASAVYTWSADKAHVTGSRVCQNDTSHIETETVDAVYSITKKPTCTEMGESTYTSLAFTNGAFEVQKIVDMDIPALGHDWDKIEFAWSEDCTEVTVTAVCTHDASHQVKETVKATGKETKAPTCETQGEMTYTSDAFETPGIPVQMKIASIPATGHQWGAATYTWSADKAHVTGSRVCQNDTTHIETETVDVVYAITKEPTCTEMGESTYTSLAFTNDAFEVQKIVDVDIFALGHDWDDPTYVWSEDGRMITASRLCKHDAKHSETESVSARVIVVAAPTEMDEGEYKLISEAFASEAFTMQEREGGSIPALHTLSVPSFPESLTEIEEEAFEHTPFQAVILPETVNSIGNRAFANCQNLVYVYIPESITSIPTDAFADCPNVIIDWAGH